MKHVITLIPGDGIGPEVTKPALEIIKSAGVKVEWETFAAGAEGLKHWRRGHDDGVCEGDDERGGGLAFLQ